MTTLQQLIAKVGIDTTNIPAELNAASTAMQSGLSTAAQSAQLRVDSLSERLGFQQRQLELLRGRTDEAIAKYGVFSSQVQQLSLAEDRLTASMGQNARQLEITKQRIDDIGNSTNRAASFGQQFGQSLGQGLLSIVGPAALATAALGAFKGAADLAVAGENINKVQRGFDELAESAGTSGNAILEALRKASGGEISDLNLELAANKANLLGVADSAEELAGLMDIARDRAVKMGLSTTQAFDNLVTGLGRGSALILDNLGLIVKESEIYDNYARSIGTTASHLTELEKKEALIKAVLEQGKEGIDGKTKAIDEQANAYARLGTAVENIKNRTGQFLAESQAPTVGFFADLLSGNFSKAAQGLGNEWDAQLAKSHAYNQALEAGKGFTEARKASEQAYTEAINGTASAWSSAGGDVLQHATAIQTANTAQNDFIDTSKLTAAQLDSLKDKYAAAGQGAADAYAKLGENQQAYLAASQQAQQAHDAKIADIQRDSAARIADLTTQANTRRADLASGLADRLQQLTRDAGRKLFEAERDNATAIAEAKQTAADRESDIVQDAARRIQDARADSARKIADLEKDAAQKRAADTSQIEQQLADRRAQIEQSYQDQIAARRDAAAQRDDERAQRAEDRARTNAERLADIQAQAAQRAQDQAEDRATQAQDREEDRQIAAEDRARDHADRLAELAQRAAEKQQTGLNVDLSGNRTTVDIPGSGADNTQAQIDAENRRYQEAEQRAQEQQARQDARQERQQARADEATARALQKQIEAAQRQAAQQAEADARQQAQQDAQIARQEAAQQRAYERQLEQANAQADRQRETLAKSIADAVAAVQEKIAAERDAEGRREAEIAAAADRQRADVEQKLGQDLAKRQAHYEQQRADTIAAMQQQIGDAQAAEEKQITDLEANLTRQLQTERQKAAEQRADEQARYVQQENDRATAYAKQQEQQEKALGEQLVKYTEAQVNLGLISKSEGDKRIAQARAQYNAEADLARRAFDARFGAQYGTGAAAAGSRQEQIAANKDSGLVAGNSINVASIVVNSSNADPRAVAEEIRQVFIQRIGANGGNVAAYFGGS